ncbi:MAG: S-adenosyl-l-methionine hydroxide adenosyltransferase family protein [Flavobacteriales bacterium]
MAIITLTTDFGLKDHFVAVVKGAIYTELPEAKVVDITHLISPFNIYQTAYILNNSYKYFPKGSIHIIGVDAEENPNKKHIVAKVDDHYFICSDNGVLSLIAYEIKPELIIEINFERFQKAGIFPTKDIFVKTACHIARGGQIGILGRKIEKHNELSGLQPIVKKNSIIASVIYIDNFGNVVVNLKKKRFQKIGKGRKFEIWLPRSYKFMKIHDRYSDIEGNDYGNIIHHGTGMALFNSSGFLEIAIYKSNLQTVGGASTLLGLNYRDSITINFL